MPFSDRLHWDDMVLRLDGGMFNPKFTHVDYLHDLYVNQKSRIVKMQREIKRFASLFQYSLNPVLVRQGWTLEQALSYTIDDDAFSMILKEFTYKSLLKIKTLL